jgi:magnesium transporter
MEPAQDILLHERIQELLEAGRPDALRDLLVEAESFDLANAFFYFDPEEQYRLLRGMGEEAAAALLPMLHEPMLEVLLEQIPQDHLRALIEAMEPDDAAHVISSLEPGRDHSLLGLLDPEVRKDLVNLLSYREESAGRIMDPDVVRVRVDHSVQEALESIRRYVQRVELDEFFTVYVVNGSGVLVGSIPNWKMLLAQPGQAIREIMDDQIVAAPADTDQEEVMRLVRDHDLVSLPVVDHRGRLIGRITVDDVVDVIEDEFTEDVAQFAGTGGEEVVEYSVRSSIRNRSPWLLFALLGLFASAMIMNQFQGVFAAVPPLAFFVPLVMAMGGNSGLQSASLVIRGLATGEVEPRHFWRRVSREMLASICIGLFFAALLVAAVGAFTQDWRLGLTVGLATTSGVFVASVVGTSIPMILKQVGLDPALATGPFLTTFNDIVGVLVYLGVALLVMF